MFSSNPAVNQPQQCYNVQTVAEMCELLRGGGPNSQVEKSAEAAQWLSVFQKTHFAWNIANEMLAGAENISPEAVIFAAQTLRQKILQSFRELLPEMYDPLRQSILHHLGNIEKKMQGKGVNVATIQVQLSAALSDLYLQVPAWTGLIAEMLTQLSGQHDSSVNVVLIFLKTFPEELYNAQLRIGENRRMAVEQELAAQTQPFLAVLQQVCEQSQLEQQQGAAILSRVIYCLSSWLMNKSLATATPPPTALIAQSSLFQNVLNALKYTNCQSDVHDAATECVVNALYLVEDLHRNRELGDLLLRGLVGTKEAWQAAVAEEDHEKIQNYARLYAELCESFITEICTAPGVDLGSIYPLELLLLIFEQPDFTLVEMTFNVWYRLSEYLYQCEETDFDELQRVFRPLIERYVLGLCSHCRVGDVDQQALVDPHSELAEFRSKATESIKDVTFIIGSIELLKKLLEELTRQGQQQQSQQPGWENQEAILFVISAFIQNIVETENVVMPTFVEHLLSLSPGHGVHVQLLRTVIQIFGNLQDWLRGNPAYLPRVMQWLFGVAQSQPFHHHAQLLNTVSATLEQITERSYVHLHGHHAELFQAFEQLIALTEQSRNAGNEAGGAPRHSTASDTTGGGVSHQQMEAAALHIVRACAFITNGLSAGEIVANLERLCARPVAQLDRINTAVASGGSGGGDDKENRGGGGGSGCFSDPLLWLDRIAAVFRVLTPWQKQAVYRQTVLDLSNDNNNGGSNRRQQQSSNSNNGAEREEPPVPWMALTQRTIQTLSTTLDQFKADQRVIEHACRALRFIIRSMGVQSIVFVEPLAQQMVAIYRQHQHSCFLYLASILVDEYGSLVAIQPGLITMLNVLAECSFRVLNRPDGLRHHPDTVDDLYRLAIRFVQRAPAAFLAEPVAGSLFEGAIASLSLDHTDASRSLSKFVGELLDVARSHQMVSLSQAVQQLLLANGEKLMKALINASLFHLSGSLVKDMAGIIQALFQLDKQNAGNWLRMACAELPHDADGHGNRPSAAQLADFERRVSSATKPYDVTNALRDLTRLYG